MPEKTESDTVDTVRVNITVNKDLDKRFRETVAQTIGFKKGNLQVAIEDALEEWIKEHGKKK
jgi:hypothetical protein